jgi:Rap1a immunity proteins
MKSTLVVLILLFAAGRGVAFETGREFLKECEPGTMKAFSELTDEEKLLGGACATYISGFVGGIRVGEVRTGTKMVCSPADVEVLQAMRISVKWMNEHTEDLDIPAVELIFRSLANAFPCPKTAPPQQKDERKNKDPLL